MLSATHYRNPGDFLDRAGPELRAQEVRYSLILGVCTRVIGDLHEYGSADPWFVILEDEGETAAVALRTPPFNVLLATFSGDHSLIAQRLANEVHSAFKEIPGVVGEPDITNAFAGAWCKLRRVRIKETMQQRVYGLTQVRYISSSPGNLRQGSAADLDLVTRWTAGFHEDVFGRVEEDRVGKVAAKMLDRGDLYLWEDRKPVSMAAGTRPAAGGISIGMVYTPPELRNRGYASSCVAALCRLLLESGYRYCTLYTDLANPTSNKIYKQIGFNEVCDSVAHTFSP